MEKNLIFKTGIGQDSHRFITESSLKNFILAGVLFEDTTGLLADSDGDVIYNDGGSLNFQAQH